MSNEGNSSMQDYYLISRAAHVVERSGLAMAGAMCGTFVAAELSKADILLFDSLGFTLAMVLIGMVGFYLGIDIPRFPARGRYRRRLDPAELLSATGTFLATMAALVSVSAIVLDEQLQGAWAFAVGSWWLLGIVMQIAAGSIARMRVARKAVV